MSPLTLLLDDSGSLPDPLDPFVITAVVTTEEPRALSRLMTRAWRRYKDLRRKWLERGEQEKW